MGKKMTKEEKVRRTEQVASLFECLKRTDNEVSQKNIKKMIVLLSDTIIEVETNRLLKAFCGFVGRSAISKEDLKQEGVLAVYDAIRNYDSDNNQGWCGYCSMYVHGLLVDYIEKNLHSIKYPYQMTDDIRLVRQWMEENFERDGFIEQFPDYLERMWRDLKGKMGNKRYRMERAVAYVNYSAYKRSEETKYSEAQVVCYLVSKPYEDPGEGLLRRERVQIINDYLDGFMDQEEKKAYCAYVFKEKTIKDIVGEGIMKESQFSTLRKRLSQNSGKLRKKLQYA